jgi:hypothetical protein
VFDALRRGEAGDPWLMAGTASGLVLREVLGQRSINQKAESLALDVVLKALDT